MSERDMQVLVTIRAYGAEPAEVLAALRRMPNDVEWYSTTHGEFEILDAQLAPDLTP